MSFQFNASAVAFGARFTKPTCDVIPSVASVMLAPTGGEAYASVRDFSYKGIISFGEASAYCAGSESRNEKGETVWNSLSTVSIRNFNFFNMVQGDLLVCRISSEHVKGQHEGMITFAGSTIEGLRIAGRPVEVELDTDVYSMYPTFESFTNKFVDDPDFDDYIDRFSWDRKRCGDDKKRRQVPVQGGGGIVNGSILKELAAPHIHDEKRAGNQRHPSSRTRDVERNGYHVKIRDFGKVFVGEVVMKRGQRRLNMLRFDIGSPIGGGMTGGSGDTNGTEMDP